ncbi:uncharacterized protein PADG_05021 [Paracoccidioides brasiliensis Pb18]|uniref:Septation initiation network scaffold protein cdc11 n=1 Tax=Paracoccidioides brasiliensis (strain Pb18) TaxID=502780 RepID=C1GBM0_PARBD|nr:uncharacterized protein PADG_05021 [Paracoccidioides brasiliensis Pb18]EEH48942.2 hypothetical protein PADG_05021 [Paracoccidioides brasiliensis Pb18]
MTVSVQVQSDSPVESSTMQIKPRSKIVPAGDAPEWKKRLLLGKAPVGEGGDLFGPMELENVFKPPPPTAEPTTQTNILTSIQAKHPASVPLISSRDRIPDNSPNGIDGTQRGKPADGDQDSMERYNTSVDKAKCSFGYIQGSGSLGFDPRSRTLSGREELRNEEITPILFSKDETAREHTSRTFLESILDRGKSSVVTGKEGLYSRRRDSVVSDDYSYLSHRGEQTFSNGTEQTVEMTSQSLPEDLSVGTTDFVSVGGLISMRRGGHSNDGSFRHRQLTPSLLSTLHSSSFLSGSKLRNSPHVDRRKGIFPPQQQLKQHHQNQQSPSKFLTPYRERRETNDSRPRSSGSPLKLFGEYDTFTNNKLLRRMSQFEETYNNGPEDVQSPPSENRQRGGSQSRPTSRRNNQTTSLGWRTHPIQKAQLRVDIHSSTEQREEGLSLLPAPSLVIAQEDGNGSCRHSPSRKHSGENESQNKATVPTDLFGPTVVTTPSFPAYKHNTSDERPASNLEGDISEEDPFKSIPDLSVDELQELMAAQTFSSPAKSQGKLCSMTATYGEHGSRRGQHAIEEAVREEERREIPDFRPLTRDGRFETSSVQSKSTRFTSSCPKPDTDTDTRATSWSSEEMAASMHVQQASTDPANFLKRVDDIKWKRGQVRYPQQMDGGQVPGGLTSPRVATISFSSPLLSHVVYQEDSTSPVESEQPPLLPVPRHGNISGFQSQSGTVPCSYMKSSPFKTSSRHNGAFDIRAFMGRPISRIDEQTEDSANEDFHVENHGLSVMQVPGHEEQSMVLPGCPDMDTTYSFHLAPLSDFSLNQMDESMRLEVSYIAERTHPSSLRQVHGTFALATQDLVKHITDTEPYEPYWEHLRRLDLRGKGLITLHRLKDFCSRLEELDASDNNIGQVSGVPSSVRSLKIPCNCLTNLTSWGHLGNLQYLDVSGNKLEDLDAFAGLVHLRSLKADGNRIRNIRGVMGLNGLLTLNVRGNLVREVDFGEGELTRLINLDMRDNRISSVRNIRFIKTIEKLDLRGNQIQHFESSEVLHCLHSLNLSNNYIVKIDIRNFPNLHLLYADKNHLSTITGLEQCHYLDVLSLREQSLPSSSQQSDIDRLPVIDFDISAALSLRKLYLSSNLLSPDLLAPPGGCPSLQFLDIASCALQELPSQFGMCFPNLRVLNLNFNALADVGELLGLRRLGRVSLIGNRIARLRRLCQILRSVGGRCGALTDVDLRENPITLGFYPAPVTGSGRMWRDEAGRLVGAKKHKYKRLHVHGHSGEERQLQVRGRDGENEDEGEEDVGFMSLGGCTDIARKGFRESRVADDADSADGEKVEIEIDDQYTVPPANIIADRKYVMHLDEATRLRRRVVELMVQAAAAGRLKVFNGLPVCGGDDGDGDRGRSGCVRKDEVWRRLEELGVLKKRRRTVQLEVGG